MSEMWTSVLAISAGAALGALSRWLLGLWLNGLFPTVPPGTLLANVLGGYLIGLALAWFSTPSGVPAEWRLFVITGFLGSLTTFSTFSAEILRLVQDGRMAWAAGAVMLHLSGSLLATWAGLATPAWLGAR